MPCLASVGAIHRRWRSAILCLKLPTKAQSTESKLHEHHQLTKCVDIHHSGEKALSGTAKGTTGSGANWSHEGLTTKGKVKGIPFSGN